MALNELREALELTQEQLAELMKVSQVAVSRMERRPDMYVSTLRRVIEAMGGEAGGSRVGFFLLEAGYEVRTQFLLIQ